MTGRDWGGCEKKCGRDRQKKGEYKERGEERVWKRMRRREREGGEGE